MAIAEDASTPAVVTGTGAGTITCASFSPPAGSLLVALVAGGQGSAAMTASISDSLGGSWTQAGQVQGGASRYGVAAVFYRYLSSAPGSLTVTASFTNLTGGRFLAVRVLTGAAPTQNSATMGGSQVASPFNPAVTASSTMGDSYIYAVVDDPTSNATLTAYSGTTLLGSALQDATDLTSSAAVRTTTATTTPGSVAVGCTSSPAEGGLVAYMEVLPATKSVPSMRTWTTGEVVTAQMFNSNIQTPVNFLLGAPRTVITATGGVTVSSSTTPQLITVWNSAVFDSDGMWTGGTSLTCFTPGRYKITLYMHYPYSSTAGMYHVGINLNGSGTWGSSGTRLAEDTRTGSVGSALGTSAAITIQQYLNAGDYVTFYTTQTTGASLSVPGNIFSIQAAARWIASA